MEKRDWRIVQRSKKGTIIKTISLDADVAEHLTKQPNVSDYIRKLIRLDMNLPPELSTGFEVERPLWHIYTLFKQYLYADKGIISWKWDEKLGNPHQRFLDTGGFPEHIEDSELKEYFESIAEDLLESVSRPTVEEKYKEINLRTLNYLKTQIKGNRLQQLYQYLYAYWIRKDKQDMKEELLRDY